MIKKTTTRKTRDYLEFIRQALSQINRRWRSSVTDHAYLHNVSPGRMLAAVDLGYFEKTGKHGHYNTYKCKVPYFTLAMANQVIRHEYDKYQSMAASKSAVEPVSVELKRSRTLVMRSVIDWFKVNGYQGIIYRGEEKIVL